MSMMTIGVLLVVHYRTGSYGLAGAASAAHTLTQAFVAPFVGRLIDRRGQTAVLPGLLAVFLTGIALLVGDGGVHGPTLLLFIGAVIAGAGQLPYPSLVRTRWSYLLGNSPQLQTALALESVADEAIFATGPVIVTGLAVINPLLGPLVAGGLALVGTLLFLAARDTEPPAFAATPGGAAWRLDAMWVLIITSVLLGVVFGSIEVAMIAFAQRHGAAGLSGGLVGLIAFGSLLAGIWYGARRWHRDVAVRYRLSMATLAIGALPAVAAGTLWEMAPSALLIGLSIAPTLIAGSALVARVVPASARTEGFTWQSTGVNIGVAMGAGLAGLLIDSVGLRGAFVISPVSAGLGALVACAGIGLLAPQRDPVKGLRPISG